LAAGIQVAALPCQVDHQEAYQAWRWDSPSEAEQQDHHTRLHLVEAEEADRHSREREVATGCTVEAACQAGFEVAGQSHQDLVDWDDGEVHHWGNRRALKVVVRNQVLQAGSGRMVFVVRWEEGGSPYLKVRWERLRA
jgi:hypothetical protein